MWLIAGLGNPGKKYARTRHNVGFMVIEEIADRYNVDLSEKKEYRIGRGSIEQQRVTLVEPLLYMNLSGVALKKILTKTNIQPDSLIVIHDDLDMDTGKLRIRKKGSSGGHKGIESIIQSIGSNQFIRIKVGIGRRAGIAAEEYVLGTFRRNEVSLIKDAIHKVADVVHSIVTEGVDKAMNTFN